MTNRKKLDKVDQLSGHLGGKLGLPLNNERLKGILGTIEDSGINSAGVETVISLVDIAVEMKLNKLETEIGKVINEARRK